MKRPRVIKRSERRNAHRRCRIRILLVALLGFLGGLRGLPCQVWAVWGRFLGRCGNVGYDAGRSQERPRTPRIQRSRNP
eukprot:6244406-Pyramimonas_sp.AAC.2